ncbi:hypothetical protein FI667_g17088, partial [Globisporangium splendens]
MSSRSPQSPHSPPHFLSPPSPSLRIAPLPLDPLAVSALAAHFSRSPAVSKQSRVIPRARSVSATRGRNFLRCSSLPRNSFSLAALARALLSLRSSLALAAHFLSLALAVSALAAVYSRRSSIRTRRALPRSSSQGLRATSLASSTRHALPLAPQRSPALAAAFPLASPRVSASTAQCIRARRNSAHSRVAAIAAHFSRFAAVSALAARTFLRAVAVSSALPLARRTRRALPLARSSLRTRRALPLARPRSLRTRRVLPLARSSLRTRRALPRARRSLRALPLARRTRHALPLARSSLRTRCALPRARRSRYALPLARRTRRALPLARSSLRTRRALPLARPRSLRTRRVLPLARSSLRTRRALPRASKQFSAIAAFFPRARSSLALAEHFLALVAVSPHFSARRIARASSTLAAGLRHLAAHLAPLALESPHSPSSSSRSHRQSPPLARTSSRSSQYTRIPLARPNAPRQFLSLASKFSALAAHSYRSTSQSPHHRAFSVAPPHSQRHFPRARPHSPAPRNFLSITQQFPALAATLLAIVAVSAGTSSRSPHSPPNFLRSQAVERNSPRNSSRSPSQSPHRPFFLRSQQSPTLERRLLALVAGSAALPLARSTRHALHLLAPPQQSSQLRPRELHRARRSR